MVSARFADSASPVTLLSGPFFSVHCYCLYSRPIISHLDHFNYLLNGCYVANTDIMLMSIIFLKYIKGTPFQKLQSLILHKKIQAFWTSLVVQWLRPCAPNVEGMGSIPCQGTKILHAASRGQKKKKSKFFNLTF